MKIPKPPVSSRLYGAAATPLRRKSGSFDRCVPDAQAHAVAPPCDEKPCRADHHFRGDCPLRGAGPHFFVNVEGAGAATTDRCSTEEPSVGKECASRDSYRRGTAH